MYMCNVYNRILTQLLICLYVLDLQVNERKRLLLCKEQQQSKEDFSNVIFTDECLVQLEQHNRVCF